MKQPNVSVFCNYTVWSFVLLLVIPSLWLLNNTNVTYTENVKKKGRMRSKCRQFYFYLLFTKDTVRPKATLIAYSKIGKNCHA